MVWGMALPKGFGESWPAGKFEKDPKTGETGWFDRLTAYYMQQTPEEKRRLFHDSSEGSDSAWSYGTYPAGKFKKEPGSTPKGGGGEPPHGDIEAHEVPQFYHTDKAHKALSSLISLSSKILAVDERLKAIIERLEPGTHEFFPFELRMPKGKQYPEQYYILRIGKYFDAFSPDETSEGSIRILSAYQTLPERVRLVTTKKALNGLAFRVADFGNAHLWRDRAFEEELTCFSNELIGEVEQAGLRLPKHFKLKAV